jgi:hypothetical protein
MGQITPTDFLSKCPLRDRWLKQRDGRMVKLVAHLLVTTVLNTAKTQYSKFETNIPRKGIAQPRSQFPHSCVCERFIYSQNIIRLLVLRQENMWTDYGK